MFTKVKKRHIGMQLGDDCSCFGAILCFLFGGLPSLDCFLRPRALRRSLTSDILCFSHECFCRTVTQTDSRFSSVGWMQHDCRLMRTDKKKLAFFRWWFNSPSNSSQQLKSSAVPSRHRLTVFVKFVIQLNFHAKNGATRNPRSVQQPSLTWFTRR